MIRAFVYKDKELRREEGLAAAQMEPGAKVWLDVLAPTAEETAALREKLALHELALEDALNPGHPPKLEDFGDHLFLIAHTPDKDEEKQTRKLSLFLAKDWVVTIRRHEMAAIDALVERVGKEPALFLSSPDHLAHAALDHLTDGFEQAVDRFLDQTDEIEDEIFEEPKPQQMNVILDMRRDVAALVRVVRSQRDVFQSLDRLNHPVLSKKIRPYLRDIYDHVLRLYSDLEGVRDEVGAVRDAYLSVVNTRLSEIMRTLTVIATIMMPLTFISGIYGMNFHYMPGLGFPWGFWLTLGGMGAVALAMLYWFRRRNWI